MVLVSNRTDLYGGTGKPMALTNIKYLVLHRTSLTALGVPDADLDGPALVKGFCSHELGTKGRIPYHVLIRVDGQVEQLLPLGACGAHAIGYNWRSIGIALVGDFTKRAPTDAQHRALIEVCASLAPMNRLLDIIGHTELPGASADPRKKCPGKYLPSRSIELEAVGKIEIDQLSLTPEHTANLVRRDGWVL